MNNYLCAGYILLGLLAACSHGFCEESVPHFTHESYQLTRPAISIDSGDFDGDGTVDLIVGHPLGFSILLGKGDGTFAEPAVTETESVTVMLIDDFNVDGHDDILLNNLVYLANGYGTINNGIELDLQGILPELTGDVNMDGIPDILGINTSKESETGRDAPVREVYIFTGKGDGTAEDPHISLLPTAWAVYLKDIRDYTFDTMPDLMVTCIHAGDEYGPIYQIASKPSAQFSHFDTDILIGLGSGVFNGLYDATFSNTADDILPYTHTIEISDMNDDGLDDVFSLYFLDTRFSIDIRQQSGLFVQSWLSPDVDYGGPGITVLRANNDIYPDIGYLKAVHIPDLGWKTDRIDWYLNNGDGTMTESGSTMFSELLGHPSSIKIQPNDFNHDLRDDFAVVNTDSSFVLVFINAGTTTVNGQKTIDRPFTIYEPTPNPFNEAVTIPYTITESIDVTIEIYNVLGQRIKTLDTHATTPGYHQVVWDGRDDNDETVSNGIYICAISAQGGDYRESKKVMLMK